VPLDFCLIAHPPKGEAEEFAVHRSGNGFTEGSLSHAGRPHKAEYRAARALSKHLHRQKFQYAFLHLVQTEVFRREDFGGARDFDTILAHSIPGKGKNNFQICADNGILRRVPVGGLEPAYLRRKFFFNLALWFQFFESLAEPGNIPALFVYLHPKLVPDCLQLLFQKEFALLLAELLVDLLLYLLLQGKQILFLRKVFQNHGQARFEGILLQYRLLFLAGNIQD
jgi:hypothetical protein